MRPVEGTILTVVRGRGRSGRGARVTRASRRSSACSTPRSAAARDAVAHTPDLLPVLKEAGVVDAGGRGLHAAARRVPRGRRGPADPRARGRQHADARSRRTSPATTSRRCATRSCTCSKPRTRRSPAFKQTWAALGDSIVVVGGDGLWNCHVHTDDIGGAIEAGIEAGRPAPAPRHRPARAGRGGAVGARAGRRRSPTWPARPSRPSDGRAEVETAVVAVGVGEGIQRLLVSLGRARDRGRRPVDEPVDRADPRGGRALPVRARWSCCRTTRTSCRSRARSTG